MSEDKDYSKYEFAKDKEEAEQRFDEFSSKDPLPEVPPALLNSGDIYDYARITSMILPFDKNYEQEKLKSASYEIDFLGDIHQFNEDTSKVDITKLENSMPFTLKKNSIAFLYTETKFFLPNYIAIRFNLKISHVHRGLLLGTGPLVDPGYVGQLLIPLHNLTSEDYILHGGVGLIWVEFTKLSPHKNWSETARINSAKYISFPNRKINLNVQKFFNKASPQGRPANSSIPGEVKTAKNVAVQAEKKVSEIYEKARNWTLGSAIVVIIAIAALIFQSLDLISGAYQNIAYARDVMAAMREEQNKSNKKIESLEAEIKSLTKSLEQANKDKSVSIQKNSPNK